MQYRNDVTFFEHINERGGPGNGILECHLCGRQWREDGVKVEQHWHFKGFTNIGIKFWKEIDGRRQEVIKAFQLPCPVCYSDHYKKQYELKKLELR